jgi:hypothetical protein
MSQSPESPAQAQVTITRTHADDVRHRQIYARIDDGPNRTLLFGDSITAAVEPGEHRLRANNTLFWKTVPFRVGIGEHVEFMLINRAGRFAFSLLALLGAGPLVLAIEQRPRT